jgi:hypothetical protein
MESIVKARSILSALLLGVLLFPLYDAGTARAVFVGNCSLDPSKETSRHTGQKILNGTVIGAEAFVEHYGPSLCTKPAGWNGTSLSTTWVAITGSGDPKEIFQVGEIKCQYTGCPAGNTYFWAYGRKGSGTGACSNDVRASAHFLTSAPTTGGATYKVDKIGTSYYGALINGSEMATASITAVETCWALGPENAEFMNETYDANDQHGGDASNPTWMSSVEYRTPLQWHSMNATLGAACTAVATNARCVISPSAHDAFRLWDSRT